MDAPDFDNQTDFAAMPQLLVGKDGEKLVTIVKATFVAMEDGGVLELADGDLERSIRPGDVPWGDPEKSSIKYPSDFCISKPGTDVVVVAEAHATGGRAVPWFDVAVRVGPLEKAARIFGLRVWQGSGSGLSAPRPTTGIEMRYDYAWGGIDASDLMEIVEDARNPVGMGIAREAAALTHQPAPFIEDPADLIASARTRPAPAGIGAIGRHWEPRRGYLGTYDQEWLDTRAPLLPADEDHRASLCASPGLTAVPPLGGGEQAALLNLTPGGGSLTFALPKIRVRIRHEVKGRAVENVAPCLDTVLIDTLDVKPPVVAIVELVWRAAIKAPRRMKDARITVTEDVE